MIARKALTSFATSASVFMAVVTLTAVPAHSVETITCIPNGTDAANVISLERSGTSFTFDNQAFTCNRVTVSATTDVAVSDITVIQSTVYPLDFRTTGESPPGVDISTQAQQGFEQTNFGTLVTYTGTAASGTIIVDFDRTAPVQSARYEITFGQGGDDTPSGDSGSTDVVSGPGPHIQQFAMPETGTCDEAQPEGLNWGGVASGGWGESWAQWMNDGAGGDVCTRTLAYNTSTAAWEVE